MVCRTGAILLHTPGDRPDPDRIWLLRCPLHTTTYDQATVDSQWKGESASQA